MPNMQSKEDAKDFFTGYALTVGFVDIDDSSPIWQITYRYSRFKELYDQVRRHGSHVPIQAVFPAATTAQLLFGVDDALRTERMNALDKWMRELVLNPCLMTVPPLHRAIYSFLEVEAHLRSQPATVQVAPLSPSLSEKTTTHDQDFSACFGGGVKKKASARSSEDVS